MKEGVWLASWEIQCCGDPFAVGDTARWEVATTQSADWLEGLFGRVSRDRPRFQYSMHGVTGQEDKFTLTGGIVKIEALHYGLQSKIDHDVPIPGLVYVPTPGTEQLTDVQSDRMWDLEPKDHTARSFAGWIVEVDVATLEPLEYEEHIQQYRPQPLNEAVAWYRNRRARRRS